MKQEMLINARQSEECRIAMVEDGVLEELYVERKTQDSFVGNIYKGVVVNIEPSIQACFVDFGVGRNGFLHISDVEACYFQQVPDWEERKQQEEEKFGRQYQHHNYDDYNSRPRFKPPIQEVFKRGDEVLVQVIKDGIGNKGPTLSTYISIPGRYLVLMPSLGRVGISRKIEDEAARRRLKDIMRTLNPPKNLGFIVRTAGADRSLQDLQRDMLYLLRLWQVIVKRIQKMPAPIDIYEESDIIIRTIRDIVNTDIDSIVIDEEAAFQRAREFLEFVMPKFVGSLKYYSGKEPIFHHYRIDREIARINHRRVPLKGGGYLMIDQTEALVAIDVNSGSFRSEDNAEDTAFQMNLLAATEIARQIRLRDLGGVIVNDFIDMRREAHRRQVEKTLRDAVRRDRAKTKILRTSPFGLIEMTRQRIRPSLKRSVYQECPCCHGGGVVKTPESMALDVFRALVLASQQPNIAKIRVTLADDVVDYLNNRKRSELASIERDGNVEIVVRAQLDAWPEHLEIECFDMSNHTIPFQIYSNKENPAAKPV
ncbi:MAG: ribonuclease E/G [Planctomycetaceae bacterium]|nr:ribonuclease E/G [Planctomycetaceae bacterium]